MSLSYDELVQRLEEAQDLIDRLEEKLESRNSLITELQEAVQEASTYLFQSITNIDDAELTVELSASKLSLASKLLEDILERIVTNDRH